MLPIPEGTQGEKNTYHLTAPLLPLPMMSPEEVQDVKNTGCWPQTAEVLIKGRISVSLLHLPIHRKVLNSLTWDIRASLVTQTVNNLPAMWETWVQSLGWKNPLEEDMATHFSILAWRIP